MVSRLVFQSLGLGLGLETQSLGLGLGLEHLSLDNNCGSGEGRRSPSPVYKHVSV